MQNKFQIFGSPSSQDYDVLVFVDAISPIIQVAHDECKRFNELLLIKFSEQNLPIKEVNVNLGILENGIIQHVFKGTADEVNNSLIATYNYHYQFFPQQVMRLVKRDRDLKLLRAFRIILSMLSRTKHRSAIKNALREDFNTQYEVLTNIDLAEDLDLGDKKENRLDVYKVIAFQIGQVLGLYSNQELYSKESIAQEYPSLEPFLLRRPTEYNFAALDAYKEALLATANKRLDDIGDLNETTYGC
jgi:hypothetical protein